MTDLHEEIRKLAVIMSEHAGKVFPGDHDAQVELVRGAGRIASAFVTARVDVEDHASRPRW